MYGKPSYESGHDEVKPPAHYRWVANEVLLLIDSQAEPYWNATAGAIKPLQETGA